MTVDLFESHFLQNPRLVTARSVDWEGMLGRFVSYPDSNQKWEWIDESDFQRQFTPILVLGETPRLEPLVVQSLVNILPATEQLTIRQGNEGHSFSFWHEAFESLWLNLCLSLAQHPPFTLWYAPATSDGVPTPEGKLLVGISPIDGLDAPLPMAILVDRNRLNHQLTAQWEPMTCAPPLPDDSEVGLMMGLYGLLNCQAKLYEMEQVSPNEVASHLQQQIEDNQCGFPVTHALFPFSNTQND